MPPEEDLWATPKWMPRSNWCQWQYWIFRSSYEVQWMLYACGIAAEIRILGLRAGKGPNAKEETAQRQKQDG
jgi:hypothetical protein